MAGLRRRHMVHGLSRNRRPPRDLQCGIGYGPWAWRVSSPQRQELGSHKRAPCAATVQARRDKGEQFDAQLSSHCKLSPSHSNAPHRSPEREPCSMQSDTIEPGRKGLSGRRGRFVHQRGAWQNRVSQCRGCETLGASLASAGVLLIVAVSGGFWQVVGWRSSYCAGLS